MTWPRRVACLSAETAELCAELGAWERVVAVTAYFDQGSLPAKPVVSGFSKVAMTRLGEANPDLIFTFSDVQADLVRDLIRDGHTVIATNQRTISETADAILLVARTLGLESRGDELREDFLTELAPHPEGQTRVYFEEWNDPLISGIGWVGEIIARAGGVDVFENLRHGRKAAERTVTSEQVIQAAPDLILASWCGKAFDPGAICARPGWERIPAVAQQRIHEIPAADILQPGLGLVRGFRTIRRLIAAVT